MAKRGNTKDPYLNILKESLIEFDKMTVHKGPAEAVIGFGGKDNEELDHSKPVKDVVGILERYYFQEESDDNTKPQGDAPGRNLNLGNDESDEQDLENISTASGDGESKTAGTLPNGSQPEGTKNNIMDSDDATSASRETAEVFKEALGILDDDDFLFEMTDIEDTASLSTGENEEQGADADSSPKLGEDETETSYEMTDDEDEDDDEEDEDEEDEDDNDEIEESLFEMYQDDFGDNFEESLFEMDDDPDTAVLPKPDATVGDDGEEDDKDEVKEADEEAAGAESDSDEEEEDDKPLEVPAANESLFEMDDDDMSSDPDDDKDDEDEEDEDKKAGTFEGLFEADDDEPADLETDNGPSPKETPKEDEGESAKMEALKIRSQLEESVVERLIREMENYEEESTLSESFDDLDDLSLEDMFDM